MGILENFEEYIDLGILKTESAWDPEFQYESNPIVQTNNMGEPILIEQGLDEEVLDI